MKRFRTVLYSVLALTALAVAWMLLGGRTPSSVSLRLPGMSVLPQGPSEEAVLDRLFRPANSTTVKACAGYRELRGVDFKHPVLARRLCRGTLAYRMLNGRYPLCQLSPRLPAQMLSLVKRTATRGYIRSGVTGHHITAFTYPAGDVISDSILHLHNWDGGQVAVIVGIARRFPTNTVTFLDIGSNIGVYSLQAREAGFATVAVDANLRNLLRMRLSADHMGWRPEDDRLRLTWMFFHSEPKLSYLGFLAGSCNVGAAAHGSEGAAAGISGGKAKRLSIADTIPVMTGRGDDLVDSISTRLVVAKLDIESNEFTFLSTAHRLFRERDIVALQMEWWRLDNSKPASVSPNYHEIVGFFTERNYTMLDIGNLMELDAKTTRAWDIIWVRRDFLSIVRGGHPG